MHDKLDGKRLRRVTPLGLLSGQVRADEILLAGLNLVSIVGTDR